MLLATIATVLLLLQQTIAMPPKPDYALRCPDPTWPDKTGNFKMPPYDYSGGARRSLEGEDSSSTDLNITMTTYLDDSMVEYLKTLYRNRTSPGQIASRGAWETQCCRPTWECWMHRSKTGKAKNWSKKEWDSTVGHQLRCCLQRFYESCPYPPNNIRMATWYEPPACSNPESQ